MIGEKAPNIAGSSYSRRRNPIGALFLFSFLDFNRWIHVCATVQIRQIRQIDGHTGLEPSSLSRRHHYHYHYHYHYHSGR